MILYALPISNYGLKVRLALAFKGLALEMVAPPGGYRSPEYAAIVPAATIPALVEDGFVLTESDAIIEYFEETHPEPTLLPGGARERARARMLSRLHDLRLEAEMRALFREVPAATRDAGNVAQRFAAMRKALALITANARPGPFLAGPAFSVADLGMASSLILAGELAALFGETPLAAPWLGEWDRAMHAVPALAPLLAEYEATVAGWIAERSRALPS